MGRKTLVGVRRGGVGVGGEEGRRKKGKKGKGARWTKGHACVSNPKTTKYREKVSSGFLHPVNPGNSLLTVKNLSSNRVPSVSGDSDDNDTILSSDVASLTISDGALSIRSTASSVRTMASGWSQVSHNAFERFLRKFGGDIVAHKDMLSILGAASEVIGEAGGKKNETEFFATFMSLLDNCTADQYEPLMLLVCIIIGKVSPAVLQVRFRDIYPKISAILSYAVENDIDRLIRTSIEAMTKLFKAQDNLNFEDDKDLETAFYGILRCSLHTRPRVRRKIRISVKTIITCFNEKKQANVIPKIIIGWIMDQLESYPMCDSKVVADALTLLTSFWSSLQKVSYLGAKKLFELVLKVMSSGDSRIMKIGLAFFVTVYQNDIVVADTDQEASLTGKLLAALWDLLPDWRNIDVFLVWLRCVLLGIIRCSTTTAKLYLPRLFEIVSPVWLTNYGKKVVDTFQEYLPHVVSSELDAEVLDSCFQILAKSYLVVPPNPFVLQVTECLLDQITPEQFTVSGKEVFHQLTPLHQSSGVSQVLGKFVKAYGVENLWACSDVSTQWRIILPLLSEHLHGANIAFWKQEILPQAGKLGTAKLVWQSFIGFSRNPNDPENFPAEMLGMVISDKVELRLSTLAALRQFIDWSQCKSVAIKYSKNYLPVLFNLYIQEKQSKGNQDAEKPYNPGHSDAIGATLQKYLPLCEETFINQLLDKALSKLQESEKNPSAISDLIAFLSYHTKDISMQEKVLSLVQAHFGRKDERKRIYRVMTFLSRNESISPHILESIYQILCKSKGETVSNAAAIRMECINVVCDKNPIWMKALLSEVILNLISVNGKAKRYATEYVAKYCELLKDQNSHIDEVLDGAVAALKSSNTSLVSATTFFLFLLFKELKPAVPSFDILNICFNNLRRLEDGVVWKYSLAFVNLNLSLYKGQMGPLAKSIGEIAGDSKYPRREINKMLARMIRTFGTAGLKAVLPNADEPKMRNRIRNLCRKIRKMKEEKTTSEVVEEDSELEEDEFGQLRSESKHVVIKEGLVDFLNPSEISRALVSEKSIAPKEAEFKETKDGKLIIGDLDGDDDDSNEDGSSDSDVECDKSRLSRKRKASTASVASSKKSAKSAFMSKSGGSNRNPQFNARGSFSTLLAKRRKKLNSTCSVKSKASKYGSSGVRFK